MLQFKCNHSVVFLLIKSDTKSCCTEELMATHNVQSSGMDMHIVEIIYYGSLPKGPLHTETKQAAWLPLTAM